MDIDISKAPVAPDFVRFREGFGQKFLVTIDTEEEFDWAGPVDRESHGVDTVPALRAFRKFCEGFGVVPIFLLDYPVVTSPLVAETLGDAIAAGLAEGGMHLHPWVNPPFTEELSDRNSFAGNLPADVEREKLLRLREAIQSHLGAAPVIYRAGRYGVGPHTAAILAEAGIAIDSSVRTHFDYSAYGGPDFRRHPLRPYWIDRDRGLMELPLTTVYWGVLRQLGPALFRHTARAPKLRGVLARTGMAERIPLTPEGITPEEAIRGIDIALDEGLPLLVFSFHGPSLAPGHTPYVRSEADLKAFYGWWEEVFAYLARRNVLPSSAKDIMESVVLA